MCPWVGGRVSGPQPRSDSAGFLPCCFQDPPQQAVWGIGLDSQEGRRWVVGRSSWQTGDWPSCCCSWWEVWVPAPIWGLSSSVCEMGHLHPLPCRGQCPHVALSARATVIMQRQGTRPEPPLPPNPTPRVWQMPDTALRTGDDQGQRPGLGGIQGEPGPEDPQSPPTPSSELQPDADPRSTHCNVGSVPRYPHAPTVQGRKLRPGEAGRGGAGMGCRGLAASLSRAPACLSLLAASVNTGPGRKGRR